MRTFGSGNGGLWERGARLLRDPRGRKELTREKDRQLPSQTGRRVVSRSVLSRGKGGPRISCRAFTMRPRSALQLKSAQAAPPQHQNTLVLTQRPTEVLSEGRRNLPGDGHKGGHPEKLRRKLRRDRSPDSQTAFGAEMPKKIPDNQH